MASFVGCFRGLIFKLTFHSYLMREALMLCNCHIEKFDFQTNFSCSYLMREALMLCNCHIEKFDFQTNFSVI